MKHYLLSALFAVPALCSVANANATVTPMSKYLENRLTNVCEAVLTDSPNKLRRAVKESGISYNALMRGLKCNGMDPITFGLKNNATVSAQYFASRSTAVEKDLLAKQ